ncbi:nicotinic acetylcholine receptor subunit beta3-like protein [Dinothrombium tinctorium]|uniref:Nicotinic acetylcholine receptor subunit beta3-like protein n=1 Tax=Dinothrombium tinctorium TaxID=1965070 RepID=A0A443R1V6_9ACAR|nr:nicotinic acetylcholine receptor subunit beta3-like protein [Dinothrombium tinctorium]
MSALINSITAILLLGIICATSCDACTCEKMDFYQFFCDRRFDFAVTLSVISDPQVVKGGRVSYRVQLIDEVYLNQKARKAFQANSALWIHEVQSTCNLVLEKGVKYVVRGKISRKGVATTNFCLTYKASALSKARQEEVNRIVAEGLRCNLFKSFTFVIVLDQLSNINALRDELFKVKTYEKHAVPISGESGPIVVEVGLLIDKISDMMWHDYRLTWTPSSFDGLDNLVLDYEEIWRPYFSIFTSVSGGDYASSFNPRSYWLNYTGQIYWAPQVALRIYCRVDLTDYPYDSHKCAFYLTIPEDASNVNLTTNSVVEDGIYGPFYESPKWIVTSIKLKHITGTSPRYNYSSLRYMIEIKRNTRIYTYYVILPYIASSMLAAGMFWMEIGSAKRFFSAIIALIVLIMVLFFVGTELGFHSAENTPYAGTIKENYRKNAKSLLCFSEMLKHKYNADRNGANCSNFTISTARKQQN